MSDRADEPTDEVPTAEVPDEVSPAHADAPADPRVAEALERLQDLADRPPSEHVEVYEDVHRVLQESLSQAQQGRPDRSGPDRPPGDARP